VVWAVDHQFTAKLPDGSSLAVAGGIGETRLSLRALTPETCRTIFALAEAARAGLAAPGLETIRPRTAAGPRDLCNRLAPAFAAWRWQAPPLSPGLEDLDRRRVSLAGAGAPMMSPAPTAPAGQGALSRRALFY
jgi:hypothetical protein